MVGVIVFVGLERKSHPTKEKEILAFDRNILKKLKKRTPHAKFPPMVAVPKLWLVVVVVLAAVIFVLCATVWKSKLEDIGVTTTQILKYGSIPVVSVCFTYFHIWLALWMTFYPLEYFGILQIKGTNTGLGWQGIIPNKAEKMARKAVQLMTQKLIDVKEVFSQLDPTRMADEMESIVYTVLEDIIDGVAREHAPSVWNMLPQKVKKRLWIVRMKTVHAC